MAASVYRTITMVSASLWAICAFTACVSAGRPDAGRLATVQPTPAVAQPSQNVQAAPKPVDRVASSAAASPLTISLTAALASLVVTTAGMLGWNRVLKSRMYERTQDLARLSRRHLTLVEHANDAIITVAPADGTILEANRKIADLTGLSRESLLCSRLQSVLPEADRPRAARRLTEALVAGVGHFEDWVLVRSDGGRVPVDVSATVVDLGHRKVIQLVIRDITERRGLEAELLRRNRNLSALNSISATIASSLDQGEILEAALAKITEVTEAQAIAVYLIDESSDSLVLRSYRGHPPILAAQRTTIEKGTARAGESALPWWPESRAVGTPSFVSIALVAKDKPLGTLIALGPAGRAFSQDDLDLLTATCNQVSVAIESASLFGDLRTAVGDLFYVKRFSENVLDSMTNGLITVDLSQRITMVNRAAEQLLGYSRSEAVGRPMQQVLVSRNGLEHVLADTRRTGVPSPRTETSVIRKSGEQVPVDVNASILRDGEGTATGMLIVFTDLSNIKKMQEERRMLDRLAALGQMSAVVAHEVRNPLASISASVDYLGRTSINDDQRETVGDIKSEIDRMLHMVEDILMFSKPPALTLTPRSVGEIVSGVASRTRDRAAAAGVRISQYLAPDLPSALVDDSRLDRAVSNLVANAIDAMPGGGDLRVSVRATPPSSGLPGSRPSLTIEVADTGEGIPEDKLSRIFEPYFTTKSKGTGLGLAITRSIIQEHGGRIEVHSRPHIGTVVTVVLPVSE